MKLLASTELETTLGTVVNGKEHRIIIDHSIPGVGNDKSKVLEVARMQEQALRMSSQS